MSRIIPLPSLVIHWGNLQGGGVADAEWVSIMLERPFDVTANPLPVGSRTAA
jgi:hypothetical protein